MNKDNFEDKVFVLGSFAIKSMLYEVSAFPKPGLVTPLSKGAHRDMDYFTFIDSTCALLKTMIKFSECGFQSKNEKEIFKEARNIGKVGDLDMVKSTKGVNTHRGMIFLMGVSLGAVAKTLYENKSFIEIEDTIKNMTKGLVDKDLYKGIKLKSEENLTYGEVLYKKYGITGIRGEVEKGIPIVFRHSLRCYEKNRDLNNNDRLIDTLINIMTVCEDTNIIHRHNLETLKYMQSKAKYIVELGGMRKEGGRKAIRDLNDEFIEKNISPGGSADILALTVFFSLVKENYNSLKD
ncbi:triphosphoribosyl-dephospho-CoA synthase CitG [Haloimpatiens sp. FM7315]|uniref:triphosphoribosyl-dephospho-CoA synthase CitG n=1 Tax=Haloimpatiens sp. FM7315 TaxID=3298609 RepID=UPI0035A2EFFE